MNGTHGFIQKSSRLQSTSSGSSITFAAPGSGKYNIITHLVAESDAACTIAVESPASTTLWQTKVPAGGGFEKSWNDQQGIRGAENAAVIITVSAGTYTISAGGYVTP